MANGHLPTSPLFWQGKTPELLPYGVHAFCFNYCPPTPEGQLSYFGNCLCTYVAQWPPTDWQGNPLVSQYNPSRDSRDGSVTCA